AQIPDAASRIADGDEIIVDGFTGEVILHPAAPIRARYAQQNRAAQARRVRMLELSSHAACTRDGTAVEVMANVGCREDVVVAADNGADGVGLYRIEQFYLARSTPPTV